MIDCIRLSPYFFLLIGMFGMTSKANAHATGENYFFLSIYENLITVRAEIHFEDLFEKIPVRSESKSSKGYVNETEQGVVKYIRENFYLSIDGSTLPLEFIRSDVI